MTMKYRAAGFRSKNLQYTTGAGPSAKENSGVACASWWTIWAFWGGQPSSQTLRISQFSVTGQPERESTVERGFSRKVAPGDAIITAPRHAIVLFGTLHLVRG